MYKFMGLMTGVIIAVMVAINGRLTLQYGIFTATAVIHVVGILFALLLIKGMGKKLVIRGGMPFWLYTGGVIGVFTTVFNNFAFGKISLTGIVALGLLGQTAASLLIDCLGLFGMMKCGFRKSAFIGLAFSAAGIMVMVEHSAGAALYAVLLSICSGITVVLSRTVNAGLSKQIGELQGSFINHVAGLVPAVIFLGFLGRNEAAFAGGLGPVQYWTFLGGTMGVVTVLLCNISVPHVSAFQLTLLTFVGQVFMGIVIDMITREGYSKETFIGGLLVAAGIGADLMCGYIMKTVRCKSAVSEEKMG